MRIMPFMKRKKGVQFAGAGASDYDDLSNKPQIGGVTLTGNKTLADLGVQSVLTFDSTPTENSSNPVTSGGVWSELNSNLPLITGSFYTQVMFGTSPNANGFYISNALTIPCRSGFTLNSVYKIDGESSGEIAAQIVSISDKARLYYLTSTDNSVAGKIATVHLTLT